MWTQIIGTLVTFVIATYIIQLFVPRARGNSDARRTNIKWDVAPMLGFFGVVVLGLSLVEALRQTVIESWALGLALGLVIGIVVWIGTTYLPPAAPQKNRSALFATVRFLWSYGVYLLVGVAGTYLAVRLIGATIGVLLASAAGLLLITIALKMFVGTKSVSNNRG